MEICESISESGASSRDHIELRRAHAKNKYVTVQILRYQARDRDREKTRWRRERFV